VPLQTGKVLNNRYRIVKLLGQGGFGAVYRAWDLNMECPRAVKENLDTSPEAQKQFKLEAQLLGQLTHLNLPKVIDHFIIPNQGQYLVMEYVEGEDLQEMLDNQGGPLPEDIVLPWIEQVCDALSYLHSQTPPIIHRDIKPANIKVTPDGKAMLVDFGIAKVFDPVLSTTFGARAVTPGYSPHEQHGIGKTDARSDIYALGATLYTLLTGQVPVESIQRVVNDSLLPAQQINTAISLKISSVIQKAMQVDPGRRYQDIQTFKSALQSTPSIVTTQPYFQKTPHATSTISDPGQPSTIRSIPKWWLTIGIILILFVVIYLNTNFLEQKPEATSEAAILLKSSTTVVSIDKATNTLTASPPTPTRTPKPTNTYTPSASPTRTSTPLRPTFTPSITPTPTPQLTAIEVKAYCSDYPGQPNTVTVKEHQPIILTWMWRADTVQHVQDHLDASSFVVKLDGKTINNWTQSDIEYIDIGDIYPWRVTWKAAPEFPSVGSHKVERIFYWYKDIFDGGSWYGPGTNMVSETDYCNIIVEEY
jgi:serine/threonine-protein kinase